MLEPSGPSATMVAWLWWGMFGFFSAVFVVVLALWLYAIFRRKPTGGERDEERARQVTNRWILGGGIALPLLTVIVLLIFGIPVGYRMLPIPLEEEPLRVEVIGHQWWWEVRYPDAGVVTANELYLPAGEPVDFYLNSEDVIHSFWIPRLGGKLDVLPGRTNLLRLQADAPGSFRAQCAEFCGWGHAHMVLPVEARSRTEFSEWIESRQQPVTVAAGHEGSAAAFREHCGDCHRVAGVSEGGSAPDLSSVAERPLLGGAPKRDHNPIGFWMRNHRRPAHPDHNAIASGAVPDHSHIAPEQQDEIAAWLESLAHE